MTDYLQLARERAPQTPTSEDNPYLPLAQEQQKLQQNQVRTVLEVAYKDNPDVAAERQRLSQTSGVPLRIVERNLDALRVKEQARAVDLLSMAQDSPVLYRQLLDPTFTTTAVDDLGTLKSIESAVGKTARYVMGADGKGGLPSDVAGAGKTLAAGVPLGLGKMANDIFAVVADLFPGGDNAAAYFRNSAQQQKQQLSNIGFQGGTSTRDALKSGLESSAVNLALLPVGLYRSLYATANQAASTVAGLMSAGVGADAFNEARSKGKNEAQALTYAIPQATFEYVFERIPASKLFGDIAANTGLVKTIGKQMFSEGWTEQVTTVAQDFNAWMNLNPEKTLGDFIAARPEAAYQTFIATLVGVGVQTTTIKGINKIVEKASQQKLTFEQDQFQEQMALAAQSLLRQRSPDQFRAHIQQVLDSNDDTKKEIFVDGGVLAQLPQDMLAQLPESVQSQIAEAAATSSPVAIPLADVLTVAPGTPLEQVLNDNARMTPDALSRIEAQRAGEQAQEFIKQEADRVLSEVQDQQAWAASSENVKNTIWTQLNNAGRFSSDVNEAYATLQMHFFSTMAARLGITPEDLYQRYSLKVGAQAGQGAVLHAGEKAGEVSVEGYHFSPVDRTTLTTEAYGTGLKGSARDEILNHPDKRLRQRLSFYFDKGTGIRPESGVGGRAHRVQLTGVYDSNADPLKLRGGDPRAFEAKLLDLGYSGYLDRMDGTQPGQVVMLGRQNFTPELLGAQSRIENGQRVAPLPAAEPQWKTQASGAPEALQSRLERMQAMPAWQDYEMRIEGNELQVRRKGGSYGQSSAAWVKLPKKATTTAAVDIRKGPALAGDQRMDIHQVGAYFDKITGGAKDVNDPKAFAKALKTAVAEIEYQLTTEKSGLDWYEDDIKAAFEVTQRVIPELADPAQRQLFSVIAGLQSPGTNARDNWAIAAEAFQSYKATGVIPGRNPKTGGLWAGGPVSATKEKSLNFLNTLVQDLGESAAIDWLMGTHTVKELNEARAKWGGMGPGVSGKATDTLMGLFAFGPKVGPFVMNINGIHELTIDVWATRTFNRYFGQMVGPDGKIIDAPTEPQRRVAKELFNAAAEKTGIKPYQVQSVLWFAEQQLFNHLGTGTPSYGFSDGARKFASNAGAGGGLGADVGNAEASAGEVDDRRTYQQSGNGGGRYSSGGLAPLEGAPAVASAAGPDARLVAVAEQYARDNGIDLKRQAEYAQVNPERAARIAAAYEAMEHAPNDPAVREAYENLARQTVGQYQALQDAGYQFYLVDETNDPYAGNPWNAMRDLRTNQRMGVFATEAGFGTSEFDPAGNPLLADTGLEWGYGSPEGPKKRVLFNDLFRAVHDAFGHGLEGAGFRAQGEENAWQAHVRLFTGSAVGAITSETRGQNSWLNYGPNGESNQTAKVEDTVFADQKTGLMPEWTWTEGRVGDASDTFNQEGVSRADLFLEEFADETATVDTGIAVSSKGETLQGGNTNSAGQRITATKQGLQNFWKWFGQSEATDDSGKPLVLYHSTNADINVFETGRTTVNSTTFGDVETSRYGVFLTPDIKFSQEYLRKGEGQNVMQLYASLQNPVDLREGISGEDLNAILAASDGKLTARDFYYVDPYETWTFFDDEFGKNFVDAAKAAGYDGAIMLEAGPDGNKPATTYVAFDPNQVKSATGNQGPFNANDPNILKQGPRGTFNPQTLLVTLGENADLSTFLHESGHFFLEVMADLASQPGAPQQIVDDMNTFLRWAGIKADERVGGPDSGAPLAQTRKGFGGSKGVDAQDLTPEFKAWFKGSKIADERGRPLVVYHATPHQFSVFRASKTGTFGAGIYLASSRKQAENFVDANGTIMPLYVSMVRPFYTEADYAAGEDADVDSPAVPLIRAVFGDEADNFIERLRQSAFGHFGKEVANRLAKLGHDGIVVRYPDGSAEYIAFDPAQIKSATSNNGAFDPTNPSILAQDGDLPADATQPAGRTPLEVWNAMTLDQKRPYHEKWAESFEQYLFEGKAPNVELQGLFRRFRSWMVNVYKSLTHFMHGRNLQVNDEVRKVFDRMVATDEQIAQAEETAGLLPDFNATNEAIEKLQARSLRDLKWAVNARNKTIKALQKQARELRKGVEAEVTAEVNQMPEFAAKDMLDKTRKENKEQLNDTELAIIADAFQYPSVDAMLQAIDAAGSKADTIEGMTDQRMLERHGDLVDQRAIEEAANEAVHNEARAKSLATELKSQAEILNPRQDTGRTNTKGNKITVNAITEAAKQFAQNLVARRRVKDLRNAAHQHRAAEARAGKRWQEATAAGKTQDAVQAKRDQVLNNFTVKALQEAQTEAKKVLEFFRRVTKDSNEKTVTKGRDPDVVNAMRAILASYDIAPRLEKSATEYLDTVEKNDPAMYGVLKPAVDAALNNAKPIAEMTMEELRGLHDEMQAMWHLAKRSRQMEIDGKLLDMQDAEDELQARMQAIGVPLEVPGESGALTPREELARKLQFAGSILRRVEQWAQGMGNEFTRLVFQPVKDAANAYRADRVKYRKKYQALIDNVAPELNKGLIEAPELGYTFGRGHNGIGHAELLHAILHTGNESNKRKLLLGRKWAAENDDGTLDTSRWDAFLKRMHDTGVLNKAHYDFAQGVWDLLEETKPLAQKTHRDVFGRYFAEVTADSFETPFGSYRGGYVPAQADPRIVQDADLRKLAEAENENMAFSFPATNKGFTKGRVEYNRPLMLDLRTIGQHIDKVLLFSHMEPAARDVQKLLSRKGVSYSLGRIDPTLYAGMLTPWLNRSARQIVETPIVGDGGVSRMLSAARSRAGMALMFANVSNTLQQLTGFSLAAVKVKPASMMKAAAEFIAGPKKLAKTVADASEFMAGRMENEISALNDAMDAILLDPSVYEKAQAWSQKHAYFLQTAMANTMEPIIWTAAYNDAVAGGQSDRDAVRHADSVIRTTQGSTLPEDVSRIETGPAYARIFTQFIGYFNMMANTNATELKKISQEMGLKKGAGKALGVVALGLLVPLWVAEAIAQAMRGGPDDEDKDGYLDDWLAAVFGMGTIKGSLAMVPFIGQLANAGINRFNGNPADDKMSLSPAVSLLESAVGVPVDVYKAITGDVNKRNMVRDVASAVSIATGLPAVAVARPLGYLAGVADDKIDPTGPVDAARGMVTGTPSPASK